MRDGKSFRAAHHEGGSRLDFNGTVYRYVTYGEEESETEYATDGDVLKFIRNFYDWESRKETFPHRPPEVEVWNYIQRQLMS